MCYSSFCVCAREYFWALSFMPFTIFLVQHSISQQQKRFGWNFFSCLDHSCKWDNVAHFVLHKFY